MSFVIITTSRNNGELLVMVDRKKQKKSFWSNCLRDAFVFGNEEAAKQQASRYKFNNPRVVAVKDALRMMPVEPEREESDEDYASADPGWDAHKNH